MQFLGLSVLNIFPFKILINSTLKWILIVVLYLTNFQIYAQEAQISEFNNVLFQSNFSQRDNIYWQIKDQDDYNFLISQNKYLLSAKKGRWISDLKFSSIPKDYLVETNIKFLLGKIEWGSAGIIFGIKGKIEGALVIQINKKGKFRICRVIDQQSIKPISSADKGEQFGWMNISGKLDYQKPISIGLICYKSTYSVYINNQKVYKDTLPNNQSVGSIGYYLEGPISVESDQFLIKTVNSKIKTESIPQRSEIIKPEINTDSLPLSSNNSKEDTKLNSAPSGDILKLSDNIIALKKEIEQLKKENSNLKIENKLLKDKESDYEEVINNFQSKTNANPKTNWITKNNDLEKENEYLKNEIAELKQYKKLIQENKDGDLLVVMTENLRKSQNQNLELQKKLEQLNPKKTDAKHPIKKAKKQNN